MMTSANDIEPPIAARRPHPAVRLLNAEGACPLLLLCDHATNWIPPEYGALGLSEAQLSRHIAYDIGARLVTERLSFLLDAPALFQGASRLLIDPNRTLDDPTSIAAISDGTVVPGNRMIAPQEREARARRFFHPYHRAIDEALERFAKRGVRPALLLIHSYNPVYKGKIRPWEIGFLWITENPFSRGLIEDFAAQGLWTVGDNAPYDARNGHGYTVETHIEPRRLPNALVELRNDLIATEAGAMEWADRLAEAVGRVLDVEVFPAGAPGRDRVA